MSVIAVLKSQVCLKIGNGKVCFDKYDLLYYVNLNACCEIFAVGFVSRSNCGLKCDDGNK